MPVSSLKRPPLLRTASHRCNAWTALTGAGLIAIAWLGPSAVLATKARADIMAIGIDRKFVYDANGKRTALESGRDEVVFFDLKDPENPAVIGSLPLENSIIGPPTNIAITPDQRLALIANAVHSERLPDGQGWTFVPADELHVVDLAQQPPRLVKTLKVGSQPSGISVARSGKLALVANRSGKSISVLAISGSDVVVRATIPMGDVVTSVAITPDGKAALAAKFAAHKVALLKIDASGEVTYTGRDLPVGLFPWTVTVSPDGARALVTNVGADAASDGNAKTVSVIDLRADPIRVVQHLTVGDAPEGIAVSPDGRLAAVTILQGSYDAPQGSWWQHSAGLVSILRMESSGIKQGESVPVEAFPEGVGFSPDSHHIYVGNFASSSLAVLGLDAEGHVTSNKVIKLPGPAASLRIGSQ